MQFSISQQNHLLLRRKSINESRTTTELSTQTLFATLGPIIIGKNLDVQEMKLDNDNIFVITKIKNEQGNNTLVNNRIERVSINGGKIITLSEDNSLYQSLFLDDDYAYWLSINNWDPSHPLEFLKRIAKNGGKPNILYQEEGNLLLPETQDNNYIIIFSYPADDSSLLKIIQINKKDNSKIIVSEGREDIYHLIVHNGYIYWSACALDSAQKKLLGIIKRNKIGGSEIDTIFG